MAKTATDGTAFERAPLGGARIFDALQERWDPVTNIDEHPHATAAGRQALSKRTCGDHLLLTCLHEEILEVEKRLLRGVHVDERGRDTCFAATARTADLVHVVLNLLGHGEDDNVLMSLK